MSIKEIKEAIEDKKVIYGINQTLRKGKKLKHVFIAKDSRDSTVEKLDAAGIEFDVLKSKSDLAKELNLDFYTEVISIK
jgi:ribosomal protein L7Ae-like RNA K-turn-binding protein